MNGNVDWKDYHSALSQCAELLDNMKDGDPITDTPKFLAEKLASAAVAPWPDFLGQPIHHGARLLHPFDGSEFVAVRLNGHTDEGDAWRAVYDDGTVSRLCLQIGDKGQAVLSQKPASVPQSTVQVVAGFMLVVPDSPNPDCEEDDGAPWVIDAKRAKTFLSEPGFGPCKLEPIYRASHASTEVAQPAAPLNYDTFIKVRAVTGETPFICRRRMDKSGFEVVEKTNADWREVIGTNDDFKHHGESTDDDVAFRLYDRLRIEWAIRELFPTATANE